MAKTVGRAGSVPQASSLEPQQRCFWDENGFLVLPAFFAPDETEQLRSLHDRVWQTRPRNVIVDSLSVGGRMRMSEVLEGSRGKAYKVNDLYLDYPEMRRFALDGRLTQVLAALIGDAPTLCNTLSLDFGSEQELHADSLYMTPPGISPLVAAWIALEDCHPDAGPLVYVPGSHAIPPYRFSDGRLTEIYAERSSWRAYIHEELERLGLVEDRFLPRRGDVLIWHGQLLHGGAKRNDAERTRQSVVCHYFAVRPCRLAGYELRSEGDGYWMRRAPQAASGARRLGAFLTRRLRGAAYRVQQAIRGEPAG